MPLIPTASIYTRTSAGSFNQLTPAEPWRESVGDKAPGIGLERVPGCHPERSEGSLRRSSQALPGVYPERSAWAQGDRHSLQISGQYVSPFDKYIVSIVLSISERYYRSDIEFREKYYVS